VVKPETFQLDLVAGTSRLLYIDNLRIALIVLVVLHHVAMAYGAGGLAFYYVELHPSGFSRGLLIFVLTNQAWFMGAFFLIAGYFTPGSLQRKGAGAFLRDRMLRLGIPLVVFMLLLNPLSMLGSFYLPDYLPSLTWDDYEYTDYVRMGPMWFVAMLLIFSFGYVAWRALLSGRQPVQPRRRAFPGYPSIGLFIVLLAGISFLVRTKIPVGQEEFGFPSLAYVPQYLGFFAIGIVAKRNDWLRNLPVAKGAAGFAGAIAATVVLFPLAFSGRFFSLELTEEVERAFGEGGHWRAAVYALWDSMLAVGLCLGLIVLFRSVLDRQRSLGRFAALHSYAVYVVHIPVVVLVAVLLRGVDMEHLLKFGLAAVIAVPAAFVVAALVRRLPFAARVL
jgi:glucan biosynthesis protein C